MYEVKNFLSNYDNEGTRINLRASIKLFFQSLYDGVTLDNLDEIAHKYFNEERDHEKDIQTFVKSINGLAPLTIKHKLSGVKNFLLNNDIEFNQKFWKKVSRRIKGSRALTLDRIPTPKEFKKLLLHMPIQGKALFFTLESSGMRIGEALGSTIEDLYLDENPARIQIRGEVTKTGNPRHAFISREAKEAIEEWLKVREDYIKSAVGKSHLYQKSLRIEYVDEKTGETKTKLDPRIFPFDPTTAYSMWKKALYKSGLNGKDKSTGREKIHPHTLRKFFRTRLGAAGIPVDVVEALMGHEGYLTEVYRRYSLEDLKKFYLQGEPSLLVFTDTKEIVEFQRVLEKKSKELKKDVEEKNTRLQVLVNSLALENQSLKTELERNKADLDKTKARVERLEKTIEIKVNSINEKLVKLQPKT
jgi:integrase